MRYLKTLNIYKASNVEYDCNTGIALSYGWWQFVKIINGKIIFNTYAYSNTTIKHQYKIRALLKELGLSIDLELPVPDGLQNLESGITYLK